MKKYICRFPNCNTLIDEPGFCSRHKAWAEEHYKPFKNAKRSNTGLYHTAKWNKLKERKLQEQPYCELCGSTTKLQIHHKNPPRGDSKLFYDYDNLATVCAHCHREITAREISDRRTHDR